MAYRLTGTDPFFRASIGSLNGYALRNGNPFSSFALIKRRAVSAWHGVYVIDQGSVANYEYLYELDPSNLLVGGTPNTSSWVSAQSFNDTTNWLIVGFTWGGGSSDWVWRWKIGAGAWGSETETITLDGLSPASIGSGFRRLIGNEAGLGDDADFDVCCVGDIKSTLSQATAESLDMLNFSTWQSVFTGAGAWLIGFETIATQVDRTGNGGDELSRSAGITLVADPAGWSWGATVPPALPSAKQPQLIYMRKNT